MWIHSMTPGTTGGDGPQECDKSCGPGKHTWFYIWFQGLQGPRVCSGLLGCRNPWLKAVASTKLDSNGHVKEGIDVKSRRWPESMQIPSSVFLPTPVFCPCWAFQGKCTGLLKTLTDISEVTVSSAYFLGSLGAGLCTTFQIPTAHPWHLSLHWQSSGYLLIYSFFQVDCGILKSRDHALVVLACLCWLLIIPYRERSSRHCKMTKWSKMWGFQEWRGQRRLMRVTLLCHTVGWDDTYLGQGHRWFVTLP